MGEQEVIELEEFLELLEKPVEIQSETLGKLEFRHILEKDNLFIRNCLKDDVEAELFCKKFLINQITKPILTVDELNDVTDEEICSILKEYFKIEMFDEYFNFNSSIDIYTIFKEGMLRYNENQKELVKPIIDAISLHKSLVRNLIPISNASTMYKSLKVSDIVKQFSIPYIHNYITNNVAFSGLSSLANTLEWVRQSITPWQNWININDNVIQAIQNIRLNWDKFQEEYQISPELAQKYLKKYHWFISPNMDYDIAYNIVEVCESSSNHKKKEINEIFINYFLDNNCENLDMLVNNWSVNPLFEKQRIKIIKDCINVIKNNDNKINCSNVIIPTLITQIDGIQNKFMELNGLSINENGKLVDSDGEILKDNTNNELGKKRYFKQLTTNNEFYDAMNDVFLNLLFQKVQPGEKCSFMQFNRHKILHGENTNYGKKEHMIRCFMILDFLSELMFIEDTEKVN